MTVKKICDTILDICQDDEKEYKVYKEQLWELENDILAAARKITVPDFDKMVATHQTICTIRNRKARYTEEEIARSIFDKVPLYARFDDKNYEDEIEILKESYADDTTVATRLQLTAKVFQYARDLLNSKPDKSKRFEKRIIQALRCIMDLQYKYSLEYDVKKMLWKWVEHKAKDIQFFALEGLSVYYGVNENAQLTKAEIKQLERITKHTEIRVNASTACQVLINAGEIDELEAVCRMDDWKRKNWKW